MDLLTNEQIGLDEYVNWITTGQAFAFSRFGDGEWAAILGRAGQTCDGQPYTFSLQRDLSAILVSRPSYYLGLQSLAVRRFGPDIQAWLLERRLSPPWVVADVWHTASIKNQFGPVLDALRIRRVILVGPERLQRLQGILPGMSFVEVAQSDAYGSLKGVRYHLAKAVARSQKHGPGTLVALCAGPAAKVLLHEHCGPGVPEGTTWIDFGSVFEPYVGVAIRSYQAPIVARLRAEGICA